MARGDYPSSKQDQFVLRFPSGMRDEIRIAAEENGRSMNSEIVARLSGDSERSMLRDKFAMAALAGYFAAPNTGHRGCGHEEAEYIWSMADSMLATRKGGA
jgi:hypothetical protein